MSDRLRLLQRQQALLREHLSWIDAEIARESPSSATAAPPAPTSGAATPAVNAPPLPPAAPTPPSSGTVDADALLERYASTERQNPADIRRGCFVVFFAALLLVVVVVGSAWLLFYR